MSDLIICTCCHEEFNADELIETVEGMACDACLESDYEKCADCEEYHKREDMLQTADGNWICQDCYENSYFTCEDCGEIFPEDDATAIEGRWSTTLVCSSCLRGNYTRCSDCGEWMPDDRRIETAEGEFICQSCYEDSYFTCDNCGEVYPSRDYAGDGLCEGCFGDGSNDNVHSYSYKPTPIFHRSQDEVPERLLYMGVELELSHDSHCDRNDNIIECLHILNEGESSERNVYLKEDSSLKAGFEIVSHPRTLASWHELKPTIEKYFAAAQEYTDGNRDGLHVHISRRGMTPAHMARLGAFIAACQDEITVVARRNSAQWAKYHKKPSDGQEVKNTLDSYDRYTALNWRNRSTAEFRIFRATLDVTEFYAAIEFSHAAYRFTKQAIGLIEIIRGNPWEAFLGFLNSHRDKYSHLATFLEAKYSEGKEQYKTFITALMQHKRAPKAKRK